MPLFAVNKDIEMTGAPFGNNWGRLSGGLEGIRQGIQDVKGGHATVKRSVDP
jgi:hypothetical protein